MGQELSPHIFKLPACRAECPPTFAFSHLALLMLIDLLIYIYTASNICEMAYAFWVQCCSMVLKTIFGCDIVKGYMGYTDPYLKGELCVISEERNLSNIIREYGIT